MYLLLAQKAEPMWLEVFSRPEALVFLIPIVAIVVGGVISITKKMIRHRERMAMIERGMHPDYPPDQLDPQERA